MVVMICMIIAAAVIFALIYAFRDYAGALDPCPKEAEAETQPPAASEGMKNGNSKDKKEKFSKLELHDTPRTITSIAQLDDPMCSLGAGECVEKMTKDMPLAKSYTDHLTKEALEPSVQAQHKQYAETIKMYTLVPKTNTFRQEPQSAFYTNFVGLQRPRAPLIRPGAYQVPDDIDQNEYEDSRRRRRDSPFSGIIG